jgi:hypothetical protein
MGVKFHFYNILIILLMASCSSKDENAQSKESIYKLDSLHTGFNKREQTKEIIELNKDTVTIVAFGHVYSLLYHEDVFNAMIEQINFQDPDYIWILGDIVFNNTDEEWNYLMNKYEDLKGRRFHAGGNHDMNYHYERYFGINENQWEAEIRFLNYVGYRYITIEDEVANYMMVNMNDSIDRIKNYLDLMLPKLNNNKQSILFTHHCTWHNTISKAEDPHTWVKKSFPKDSLVSKLQDFEYLIHGDWAGKFYSNTFQFEKTNFRVLGVGNLNEGDLLYFTTIKITKDSLWAYPSFVNIPDSISWKKKTLP